MTTTACQSADEPRSTPTPECPGTSAGWWMSLAFWCTLTVAATCYAAVALSPKLATLLQTRRQFADNAQRLVQLESEIDFLERVSAALQEDPEFASRLAAAGLRAADPAAGVPVPDRLLAESPTTTPAATPKEPPTVSESLIRHCASHQGTRRLLIAAAVAMTLFGFTFLNDSGTAWLRSLLKTTGVVAAAFVRRYRRSELEHDGAGSEGTLD